MKRLGLVMGLAGGLWLAACATPPEPVAPEAAAVPEIVAEAPDTDALAADAIVGPCDDEAYKQFDFWVGTWDVFDTAGVKQGRNVITKEEGGCLVLEKWTSVSGSKGQSYNVYNPDTDTWRQLWVSNGTLIDYIGGLDEEGAMHLEGTITYHAGPLAAAFRGEWTPNEDGTVTQYFAQYDPETDLWQDWFTGIYRPAAPAE